MNATTFFATALLAACIAPAGASDGTAPASVEIKGVRNPVLQPYRIMAAGFDALDRHRALAPTAHQLKFTLSPRASAPAEVMQGLTLKLTGPATNIALAIGADSTFTLPRSRSADADNATLVLNRGQSHIRWLPVVQSAGVPQGHVRLGDARLQCQIIVAIAKKAESLALTLAVSAAMGSTDWCSSDLWEVPTFSARRLAGATLLHGGQRIPLKVEDGGLGFAAPLRDQRYGNDTLIEVTYEAEGGAAAPPV